MSKGAKYDKDGYAKYNPWMPDYVRTIVASQRQMVMAIRRLRIALNNSDGSLGPLSKLECEENLKIFAANLSKLNAYIDTGEHDKIVALSIFRALSIDPESRAIIN